jgi:hypothetical protein
MPLYLPLRAFVTEWQPREKIQEEKPSQNDEKELDAILEKISRKGIQSLSRREKKILDAASKKRREKS